MTPEEEVNVQDFNIVGIKDETEDDELIPITEILKNKNSAPQNNIEIEQEDEEQYDTDDMESKISDSSYVADHVEIPSELDIHKAQVYEHKSHAVQRIERKYNRRKLYMKRRVMLAFSIVAIVFIIILSALVTSSYAASEYSIKVNYQENTVTIYQNGNPIKAMICSTGRATPHSGTYSLDYKYRWLALNGGVYGQYCTRIVGNILFHSVPYMINGDPSSLEWPEYDKLGTDASAGCIRLQVIDAKWIYDNIPKGTSVTFYADNNPGPLGKPSFTKLEEFSDDLRCWDPTDPDANNPWKGISDFTFNAKYYADKYADLRAAFGYDENALRNHWNDCGIREGRQASASVNLVYYLNNYADLKKAFKNDLYKARTHLLTCGKNENRSTTEDFCVKAYKANYADLQKAFGDNINQYFAHYNTNGFYEKRIAITTLDVLKVAFDPEYYSDKYSDLKKAFGTNKERLYNHFIVFGLNEGRVASPIFDAKYYVNNNSDLKRAFGKNYVAGYKHFMGIGMTERRISSPDFNVLIYKDNYPDLQKECGDNLKNYYVYFINTGVAEGQIGNKKVEIISGVVDEIIDDNTNNTVSNNTNSIVSNSVNNTVSNNVNNTTNNVN